METIGFEPITLCLQNIHSTIELCSLSYKIELYNYCIMGKEICFKKKYFNSCLLGGIGRHVRLKI